MTLSGNLLKIDKIEIPCIYSLSGCEYSDILKNAVLEMESNYHGLVKHLLFVPRLSQALWVTDLFVWHSSPRLGKNDTIFILLSLDREQGISYTYMMGSAWKKTEETTL